MTTIDNGNNMLPGIFVKNIIVSFKPKGGNGMSVYADIKKEIANECGIPASAINNKTKFMANPAFSYFNCVDVLYALEHTYGIKLPESDYNKCQTVGSLARCIVEKVKRRTK